TSAASSRTCISSARSGRPRRIGSTPSATGPACARRSWAGADRLSAAQRAARIPGYPRAMLRPSLIGLGKFLSYVLRHRPDAIGLSLDTSGWVDIEQLLQACQAHGKPLTRALLDTIVATDSKRRFAISDDGRRIRACQGHSIGVDLGY